MAEEIIKIIISAIAGAVSGGIVSLILDKRREKREDKKEKRMEQKDTFENRPELSIHKYKNYIDQVGRGIDDECDMNIFLAHIENATADNGFVKINYRLEDFNTDEWCCVIYKFKNLGKTDISCVYAISMEKRSVALFDTSYANDFAKNGSLNYSNCYDKKIRVGESFTLKVCYHKERIYSGIFSAALDLAFEDSNGRFWAQPLFAPDDKIYDSKQITHKEYHQNLSPDTAIECFKKPWLW